MQGYASSPWVIPVFVVLLGVLLAVLFGQMSARFDDMSKRFDDKFDFLSKDVNYNTQVIRDSLQQSQKLYTLQVDTNAKLNDCIKDWNNKFTTLSNTVADNKKTLEGIMDIKKELTQIAAVVVANAQRIDVANKKNYDLELFIDEMTYKLSLRIAQAEGIIGLEPPYRIGSPVQITLLGDKYLKESGLDKLLKDYESQLVERAKTRPVSNLEEVERAARYAVNTLPDWGGKDKEVDNYMFRQTKAKMFDLWQIAGIRFRDMLMEELGMEYPTEP